MNTTMLTLMNPAEVSKLLADRTKALRLLKGWTRDTLANRAGISTYSLKRFETTGKASLELVLKVAYVLGKLDEFGKLLQPPSARSIADLKRRADKAGRKRGRI